jgi:RND family efflux transporter MFP subunit
LSVPFLAYLFLLVVGCSHPAPPAPPVRVEPLVRLVQAELRTLERSVGQPGFIYAYEETSIYAKVPGYVKEWNVKADIGNRITKGQVLAQLSVPELVAEHQEKVDQIALDDAQVEVAQELVGQREAEQKQAVETREYRKIRFDRFTKAAKEKGIEQSLVDEENRDYQAARFAVDAAAAAHRKSQVDVKAAQAKAKVTRAAEQRLAALVGYTAITAPYDGVVVARNVNTGDYVQPGTGDQSRNRGSPMYIVAKTDTVRVFVDVPEMDAGSVKRGTPASVRVQADDDIEIMAAVSRTSRSLQPQTRTLHTEIDLANPDGRLLPGNYAYATVFLKHTNVRALPLAAVVTIGNQDCCYLHEDGKAVRTPVQTGLDDGKWIEVVKKQVDGKWVVFTGTEQAIVGDLSELSDGQAVQIAKESSDQK